MKILLGVLLGLILISAVFTANALDTKTSKIDSKIGVKKHDSKSNKKDTKNKNIEKTNKKDSKKTKTTKSVNNAKETKDSSPNKKTNTIAPIEVMIEMAKGTATNQLCGDKCFVPNNVDLYVGDKITWKNTDSLPHTATAIDNSFDTNLVKPGTSSSIVFKTPGEFQYVCIIHPWMKGSVYVSK